LVFDERPFDQLQLNELKKLLSSYSVQLKGLILAPETLCEYLSDELCLSIQTTKPKPSQNAPEPPQPPTSSQHISSAQSPESTTHKPPRSATPQPILTQPYPPSIVAHNPTHSSKQPTTLPPLHSKSQTHNTTSQRLYTHTNTLEHPNDEDFFCFTPRSHHASSTALDLPFQPSLKTAQRPLHKIYRTCRAGTHLDLDGDVIVFGDVNPGAEIRATGDIIILGALRGIAHAGCRGERSAMIIAFELSPTQVRLGQQIAVAPTNTSKSKHKLLTEIAYLNPHDQIEVKRYTQGKFPLTQTSSTSNNQ
ncbi:MAG: septum site-determining protein MinC, partial [Myxococcota bacterium]